MGELLLYVDVLREKTETEKRKFPENQIIFCSESKISSIGSCLIVKLDVVSLAGARAVTSSAIMLGRQ